jgi:hypothetical protein
VNPRTNTVAVARSIYSFLLCRGILSAGLIRVQSTRLKVTLCSFWKWRLNAGAAAEIARRRVASGLSKSGDGD